MGDINHEEDNEKDSYQEAREAANNAVDQEALAASNKTEKIKEITTNLDESSTEESKEEA